MKRNWLLILTAFSLISIFGRAQSVKINEVMTANASAIMSKETYNFSEWIELYNSSNYAFSLNGLYLSNDLTNLKKWKITDNSNIAVKGFLTIWMDQLNYGLHTNFRARTNKELILLSNYAGVIIDSVSIEDPVRDCSYGRYPDGSDNWVTFLYPTRNICNSGAIVTEKSAEPLFSLPAGRYNSTQYLTITCPSGSGEIRYTDDGSEPTRESNLYNSSIVINSSKTIRAKIIEINKIPGNIISRTYLIKEHVSVLPTVSISLDPAYLWDNTIGIYVEGTNGLAGYCYGVANWNQDWERPAHFEYFSPDGNLKLTTDAGIKINGACSRTLPQKSLGLYFRDKYGADKVRYPLFKSKAIDNFKSIMLRNSGNDWNRTMFQDAMMQTIIIGQMDIDYNAYTPAILYLNGVYWGIQNIREKTTEEYLYSNYNLDEDSIDLLEFDKAVVAGDNTDYLALLSFLASHNLGIAANYQYVKDRIDIESYIDYQIAEIYYANTDWPGNNIKYWKSKKPGSKWRWLLYDTDFGFGLYNSPPDLNSLLFATATDGPGWPNPPWATFLFRKMLESEEFRNLFVDKALVHIGSTFRPDRVLNIIDSLKNNIAPEIPYHFQRWGGSMDSWNSNINISRNFAVQRPAYITKYIKDYFNLGDPYLLNVSTSLRKPGYLSLDNIIIQDSCFLGEMFGNRMITIKALSDNQFRFNHWKKFSCDSISDTLILTSDAWKYLDDGTEPDSQWKTDSFDDSGWKSGNAQLGYGEGDEATVLNFGPDAGNKYITYYFRKNITVKDTSGLKGLLIKLLVDDGAVIYINGNEVLRCNMPDGPVNYQTFALGNTPIENTYTTYTLKNILLDPGENIVAVEVHQNAVTSSDISFNMSLNLIRKLNFKYETITSPEIQTNLTSNLTLKAFYDTLTIINNLFINEFCAKNLSIPDEYYEYDDWIELYNAGNAFVNIGGMYITDDLLNHLKYQIPDASPDITGIPPKGYLILWADNQPEQGILHVGFKLSKQGGAIALSEYFNNKTFVIDSVIYDSQHDNYSYGRFGDGTSRWFELSGMTPGTSNIYTETKEYEADDQINVFPNPVIHYLTLNFGNRSINNAVVEIFDEIGRKKMSLEVNISDGLNVIDLSSLSHGLYIIKIVTGDKVYLSKILKL